MKYFMAGTLLFLWMILTLLLCVSILGLIVVMEPDESWMKIGETLVETFKS